MKIKKAPSMRPPHGELALISKTSSPADRQRLSRMARTGEATQLARGLYVIGTTMSITEVVRHHLYEIAAMYWPQGVFFGKSAMSVSLQDNGEVFVAHPDPMKRTPLILGGVTVFPELGPGILPGDISMPSGMAISGYARRLVENINLRGYPAKSRAGTKKVEDLIDEYIRTGGPEKIRATLDQLEVIAPHFDARAVTIVKRTLVAVLGTASGGPAPQSARLAARLAGVPFDSSRIAALTELATMLDAKPPMPRPAFSPHTTYQCPIDSPLTPTTVFESRQTEKSCWPFLGIVTPK